MAVSYRDISLACVAFLLCVCVLAQMLGAPVTLVTLVTLLTEADTLTESVLEDFSVLPSVPEPERPSLLRLSVEFHPSLYLPVLATSVFHPPLL